MSSIQPGKRYRSRHKHTLIVQVLKLVQLRNAATMKQIGVEYRRLDQDEADTVRSLSEFLAKFEEVTE